MYVKGCISTYKYTDKTELCLFCSIERFIHKLIVVINDDFDHFTNIFDHNLGSILVVKMLADVTKVMLLVTILNIHVGDNIRMIEGGHLYPCAQDHQPPERLPEPDSL